MITVNVNNQEHSVKNNCSLHELLKQLNISEHGIAVASQNSVIPKTNWKNYHLSNQENILIIKATQGG